MNLLVALRRRRVFDTAAAQSVKRIQSAGEGIASGVWVGDMFYLSGQVPTPITPADQAKGTPAVYGDTKAQAASTFNKIQNLLKEQGLGMGDVVMMRVYMVADPAMDNKLDFAGMKRPTTIFGTPRSRINRREAPCRSLRWSRRVRSSRSKCRPLATSDAAAMSPRIIRAFATAASIAAVVASGVVLVARQVPATSVFTADQATAGRAAYAKHCASCHMPDLSGNTEVPPLAGAAFFDTWGARSTKDLLDYTSEAMPYGAPSLSVENYTSITAYILQANGGVAGANTLSASTVAPIVSVTAPPKSPSR